MERNVITGISHIVCKRGAVSGADRIPAAGGCLLNASLQISPPSTRIMIPPQTLPLIAQYYILYRPIPQYMSGTTTIVLHQETKARLDELKRHPRETYNDVVDRLVDMAIDDEPLGEETLKRIEEAPEDLKQGRYYSEEEIKEELGIG